MGTLTEEELHTIRHSLGFGHKRRWSYRNHYIGADETCDSLVRKGFMVSGVFFGGLVYRVTDEGVTAAGLDRKVRKEDRI